MPSQGSVDPQRPTPISRYGVPLFAQLGVEVGDALRHFVAARALEAMEVNHDHVAQILHAAVSQHLRALADEPLRLDLLHADVFAFARQHQRPQLQKSEVGGFVGLCGSRTANSISTGRPSASSPMRMSWSRICGQREHVRV